RDLDVHAAGAVIFDADVVAAALFLAQHRVGGRRRVALAIIGNLVKARGAESGPVARAVLQRCAAREILNVRGAQPDARVRAEILVVVVPDAGRHVEAIGKPALILGVVTALVALLRSDRGRHALVLEIHAVSDRGAGRRTVTAGILEPSDLTPSAERKLSVGEVIADDVDFAVSDPIRKTLAVVVRGAATCRLLGRPRADVRRPSRTAAPG